ncbi:MAG: ATP-binding cassette domain-containing protein, partial [Armatimonadetes bacterium]|nr:ATP-binding cassette domain-containing protein [Armatimonadota bacterium]
MLTLLENTMLPMDYCNVFSPLERPERAMELLKMVGLEQQAHKLPAAVSSGQQQAAAIARAMATDPPIIVADEPTGNLDSRRGQEVLALFQDLNKEGITVVMVTHEEQIALHARRVLRVMDGRIASDRQVERPLDAREVLKRMLETSEDEL